MGKIKDGNFVRVSANFKDKNITSVEMWVNLDAVVFYVNNSIILKSEYIEVLNKMGIESLIYKDDVK